MASSTPIVVWSVRCLHREKKEFFDRCLQLDPSALTAEEHSHLLHALDDTSRWREVPAYRHAFNEIREEELAADLTEPEAQQHFCIPYYFEDEKGQPLWIEDVIEIVSGVNGPIIPGRPQSIFRLGPSPLVRKQEWTSDTANRIAQFLRICARLGASGFLRDPLSVTHTLYGEDREDGTKYLYHPWPWAVSHTSYGEEREGKTVYVFPNTQATESGVLSLRQLYSGRDNAFSQACNAYERHAGDERKRSWVRHLRKGFKAFLNTRLTSPLGSLPRRQLLDLVLYGSDLVHVRSNKDLGPKLAKALDEHGPKLVAAAFHFCCRDLFQYVVDASYPMMQDLRHWLKCEGCAPPDKPSASYLFG